MRSDVKGLLATANRFGFLDTYAFVRRRVTRSHVAILMYHRVSLKRDAWSLEPISPQGFEMQMRYFCRNYEIIPLDKLVEYMTQGIPLPKKAVVITFDDGYKDNYRNAYPILKKYHIPATIFLTTGHIGTGNLFWWDKVSYIINHTNVDKLYLDEFGSYSLKSDAEKFRACSIIEERLKKLNPDLEDLFIKKLLISTETDYPSDLGIELILNWDEIKEMSRNGIAFGAHTVNHKILTKLPLARARWEIVKSKNDIEKRIGQQVTAFSYPNGDFCEDIVGLVRKNGFSCAVATSPGKIISPKDNIYGLNRIQLAEDFNKSKAMVCGLWSDLRAVLR